MVAVEGRRTNRAGKTIDFWLGGEESCPNPWYQYLIDGKEKPLSHQKNAARLLPIAFNSRGTVSWLEIVRTSCPISEQPCSWWAGLCSFWTRPVFTCGRYLKDLSLPWSMTLFSLSIMVGQVWTESKDGKLSPVIEQNGQPLEPGSERTPGVYRFLNNSLSLGNRAGEFRSILSRSFASVDQESRPVAGYHCLHFGITGSCDQAAQQLYLTAIRSRYKIDKWRLLGLQLKI